MNDVVANAARCCRPRDARGGHRRVSRRLAGRLGIARPSMIVSILLFSASIVNAKPLITSTRQSRVKAKMPARCDDWQKVLNYRGGINRDADLAKGFLILANACDGTYSVVLHGLEKIPHAEPLGVVFVTFVRYMFLFLFASLTRLIEMLQLAWRQKRAKKTEAVAEHAGGLFYAASEIAFYLVCCAYLSVWGTTRVGAAMSEIFASTDHVFVPILSIALNIGSFGGRTALATGLAFAGTVLTALIDCGTGKSLDSSAGPICSLIASAIFYALYRVRSTVHLQIHSSTRLNLARMIMMGVYATAVLVVDIACGGSSARTLTRLRHIQPSQWGLLCSGVFLTSAVSGSLQFEALRTISAADAQPYSALQPVFAGLFAWITLGESVSLGTYVGGALMILAALLVGTAHVESKAGVAPARLDLDSDDLTITRAIATAPLLHPPLEVVEGKLVDRALHPAGNTARRKRFTWRWGAEAGNGQQVDGEVK